MKGICAFGAALAVIAAGGVFAADLPTGHVLLPYQSPDQTVGTVNCASSTCHGSITPWNDSHVLQNEYVTYSRLDKHTRAFTVLSNDRSLRIAKNLGLAHPPAEEPLCLDCHAHNVPPDRRGPRFHIEEGVVCESCHGPAERWIKTHVEPKPSHARNIENGLYPVDDPLARARLCLSCHFGNQDKLVSHRLMGAGHPRLSFELETFTVVEPAHFRLTPDKSDGAKVWAIGQALAVEQTLDILLDPKRGHDGIFPELVLFDCHACHHPMSETRWRPRTDFGLHTAPGLVRLNDANLLMLRVIARELDPALGVRVTGAAARLQLAAAGQGPDPDIHSTARELRELAEETATRLDAEPFPATRLRPIALGLIDEGLAGHYADYSQAEQATMSIAAVVDYLNRLKLLQSPGAVNQVLARMRQTLADDEHYRPAVFQDELRSLAVVLDQPRVATTAGEKHE